MVNVNDVHTIITEEDVQKETNVDKLDRIFKRQTELMSKYHEIEKEHKQLQTTDVPVNLDDRYGQARLKDFAWRVVEEIGEAMNCLKNKPWKQTELPTDKRHYIEELADAFHFFIELCILSGLSAESLFQIYMDKSSVNKFRQRSNY